MLFDPKWQQRHQLTSLLAWLSAQPSEKAYERYDAQTCLLAQWLVWTGMPHELVRERSGQLGRTEPFRTIILCGEATCGAALARALDSACTEASRTRD